MRQYSEWKRSTIRMDHDCQKWIPDLVDATGTIACLRLCLSEFEIEAIRWAVNNHQEANALSRIPTNDVDRTSVEDDTPIVVTDGTSNHSEKMALHQLGCQFTTYVVEVNDDLWERSSDTPTIEEILQKQASDPFCEQADGQIGKSGSQYSDYLNALFIGNTAIHCAIQILVLTAPRNRLLYHSNQLVMVGSPGQWRMYESTHRRFYWLHIVNGFHSTVSNCSACVHNSSRKRLKRMMQL